MPALPALSNSLVGRALGPPPGRGDDGARVGVPLAEGPMDCRTWAFLPFSWGPGDGLRLAEEGGRRLMSDAGAGE